MAICCFLPCLVNTRWRATHGDPFRWGRFLRSGASLLEVLQSLRNTATSEYQGHSRGRGWVALASALKPQEVSLLISTAFSKPGPLLILPCWRRGGREFLTSWEDLVSKELFAPSWRPFRGPGKRWKKPEKVFHKTWSAALPSYKSNPLLKSEKWSRAVTVIFWSLDYRLSLAVI